MPFTRAPSCATGPLRREGTTPDFTTWRHYYSSHTRGSDSSYDIVAVIRSARDSASGMAV